MTTRRTGEPVADAGQLLEGKDPTFDLGGFFDNPVGDPMEQYRERARLFPTDGIDVLGGMPASTQLE